MPFPFSVSHARAFPGLALLVALAILGSACVAPLPAPPAPGPAAATALPAPTLAPAIVPTESAPAEPQATLEVPATPSGVAQLGGVLDETALKNAPYNLADLGAVQLKDGLYEQPYGQSATEVKRVNFVQAAFGDLNGDGTGDAAVILVSNSGSLGTFVHLIPVLEQNGSLGQVGDRVLGDRVQINSLAVQEGKIVVNMLTQGPNDPLCCPTQQVTETYQVTDNKLVMVSQTAPVPAATGAPAAEATAPPVLSAPAPAPQPHAATGPGAPRRIQFAPGATSATVQGSLPGRGADRWVVKAGAGQTMSVQLATSSGDAILIIFGADGTVLISDHAGATQWSGQLPTTQDYNIDVRSVSDGQTNYALTVTIPPLGGPQTIWRIDFAPGATSATVQGEIVGRNTDRWVVKAAAGQTMSVQLNSTRGQAILIIFGADGNVLISDHAGATQWNGQLPSTQDYNIDVRGVTDGVNDYTLTVTIPPLSGSGPVTTRRLSFARGATSGTVQGEVMGRNTDRWLVRAGAGRMMYVQLNSTRGQAILIIFGADGNVLISDHAGATQWSGQLPSTQDYNVDVRGVTDGVNDYTLTVTIPAR